MPSCAGCGEPWPCSDSKRTDIIPLERAKHHVARDHGEVPLVTRAYAIEIAKRLRKRSDNAPEVDFLIYYILNH